MAKRNPYENEVDIPDFVEKNDNDIDMSVFKMTEEEANENYEDENDYENVTRRKLSSKGLIFIFIVVIVLLSIASIAGWIFGVSKSNALTKLQAEYTILETKLNEANTSIKSLNDQIFLLNDELDSYKNGGGQQGTGETTPSGTKYKLAGDVAVRKGPSANNDYASFSKLSDFVQDAVYENEGTVRTRDGAIVEVFETKNDSDGNTWGRIDDNAWVCLKYQGDDWATKQ